MRFWRAVTRRVSPQNILQTIHSLTSLQRVAVFLCLDLALLIPAMLISFALQSLPLTPMQTLSVAAPIVPYLVMVASGMSLWLGLPSIRLNAFEEDALGRTALLALTVSALSAALGAWQVPQIPMGTHAIFGICYFLLVVGLRLVLYRIVSAIYRSALPRSRVLIYGAGATGTQIASALRTHDGIDPVAFVDDNTSLQGVTIMGLPVFPPAKLEDIVEARGINRILLAMPSLSQPKLAQLAARMEPLGLEVQALPSFSQLIGESGLLDKMTTVSPQEFLARAAHHDHLATPHEAYANRSVLVSGAGGSIGMELCRQLLACSPKRLVLYELNEYALYTVHQQLGQLIRDTDVELVPVLGSVTDPRQVRKVLADYDVQVVLHAAAYKHVPLVEANPLAGLANNVFGTQTLAREAAEIGVERFILVSSDKAVRPANVMGASKRLAELVIQDLATRNLSTVFTIVRFGNVLGSSGSVVPLFQDQVRRGGPVTVTDPRVTRYFMTIHEAVQLVLKAGDAALGGEVFVLDMGEPVSILQLARQVIESAGYSVQDEDTPDGDIEIRITGLRPGEKLREELTLSDGLIGTRHRKIFCAQEDRLSEIEVAAALRSLRHALAAGDDAAAQAVIQRWVEGYGTPLADAIPQI